MNADQIMQFCTQRERMFTALDCQLNKVYKPIRRDLDPDITDEQAERFLLLDRIAPQSKQAQRYDTATYLTLPDEHLRAMDTTTNADLPVAGVIDISYPMAETDLARAGAVFRSRQFSEKNSVAKFPTLPAAVHLLEDEDTTPADIVTATQSFGYATVASPEVAITRKLRTNAARVIDGESRGLELIRGVVGMQRDSIVIAQQGAALAGDNTASGGRIPDGILVLATHTTDLAGADLDTATVATITGGLVNRHARNMFVFISSVLFTKYLQTPVTVGSDSMLIQKDSSSPTGYSLIMATASTGVPVAPDATMPDNTVIFGDFSRLTIWENTTINTLVDSMNASNKSFVYSFLDYAPVINNLDAFHTVTQVGAVDP